MSKTNQKASTLTLSGSHLNGYNGPLEMIQLGRKRWWHRLFRLTPKPRRTRVHGDIRPGRVRVWRRS